jgi:hypothetical protein
MCQGIYGCDWLPTQTLDQANLATYLIVWLLVSPIEPN